MFYRLDFGRLHTTISCVKIKKAFVTSRIEKFIRCVLLAGNRLLKNDLFRLQILLKKPTKVKQRIQDCAYFFFVQEFEVILRGEILPKTSQYKNFLKWW